MSESNIDAIHNWLLKRRATVDWIDHQDGVWCIASAFPPSTLIKLHETPNAIPSRRDKILYAIGVHLQSLLTPGEPIEEQIENERELTISFAQANWPDILRIEKEMGFSGDFDTYVIPLLADRMAN